jgi:hypothetical protein
MFTGISEVHAAKNGGHTFLRNVGKHVSGYIMSYTRKTLSAIKMMQSEITCAADAQYCSSVQVTVSMYVLFQAVSLFFSVSPQGLMTSG